MGSTVRPSTVTRSLPGSTSIPSAGGRRPLTSTLPDAISWSAARREATPERARKRFSRSAVAVTRAAARRVGELVEGLQAEHLQEAHGRPVELGLPGPGAAADLADQV